MSYPVISFAPDPDTIKLQGIPGHRKGTKAKDIKPGDILTWNFGYKSTVLSATPSKSGKTITLKTRSNESGNIFTRKTTADRLFAVNW